MVKAGQVITVMICLGLVVVEQKLILQVCLKCIQYNSTQPYSDLVNMVAFLLSHFFCLVKRPYIFL